EGAYIVSVVCRPYLAILLPLLLTMPLYPSTTPAVLMVRHAFAGKGVDLTCVRSAVRPLGCRSYLCQVDRTTAGAPHTCIRLASCVGSATSTGQLSESMRT
ncbi:hypothetical protein BHE74_00042512, partial [Ensete ventricosum]